MAKLYLANCTKQRHEFLYHAPEQKQLTKQDIEIGSQIMVWRDAPLDQLSAIILQHEPYGLINVNEIDRTKHFVGICYSFDKPIDVHKIMYTVENNDKVLEERGLETRKEVAQVITHSLSQVAQDAGNGLNTLDVEVKELASPGKEPGFSETITVETRGRGRPRRN